MVVAPPPKPTTPESATKQNSSSIFHLTMEAHEIDGELAIALAQLSSDDPYEVAEAEELIASILERANTNQQSLLDKANEIAFVVKFFQDRVARFKTQQEELKVKASNDQASADRLLRYLVRTLSALHPGKTEFRLAQFDLKSRQSETTEVIDQEDIPANLCRHTITIDVPAGMGDVAPRLHQAISDLIADDHDFDPPALGTLLPNISSTVDKKLAKERIKANVTSSETKSLSITYGAATHPVTLSSDDVPGAVVIRRRGWSLT